jgi:hypothetical protein
VAEAGFPGYEVTVWWGVVAPRGTPASVINKLHRQFDALVTDTATREPFDLEPVAFRVDEGGGHGRLATGAGAERNDGGADRQQRGVVHQALRVHQAQAEQRRDRGRQVHAAETLRQAALDLLVPAAVVVARVHRTLRQARRRIRRTHTRTHHGAEGGQENARLIADCNALTKP